MGWKRCIGNRKCKELQKPWSHYVTLSLTMLSTFSITCRVISIQKNLQVLNNSTSMQCFSIGHRYIFNNIYSIGLSNYFDVFRVDGAIGAKPSIKFSQISERLGFKNFVTNRHIVVWIPALRQVDSKG